MTGNLHCFCTPSLRDVSTDVLTLMPLTLSNVTDQRTDELTLLAFTYPAHVTTQKSDVILTPVVLTHQAHMTTKICTHTCCCHIHSPYESIRDISTLVALLNAALMHICKCILFKNRNAFFFHCLISDIKRCMALYFKTTTLDPIQHATPHSSSPTTSKFPPGLQCPQT